MTLTQVSKSFGATQAVNDVSLTIKAGEVVGLLGPNGAGKTTTMRMMSGDIFPDAGEVQIEGYSMRRSLRECQARIGYLPENNPLYLEFNVSEFLGYSAALHQVSAQSKKKALDWVVPAIGLTEVYYRPIKELSKGFRQRVGIAAALLHEPPVLILDEPTEGLDPNQRTELRTLLTTLARNRTLIISTHVLQEVTAICDRIVIMHQGQVVADGSLTELSAQRAGSISVTLSGVGILTTLKHSKVVELLSHSSLGKDRHQVVLAPRGKTKLIPPVLMALAHDNKWVIWSMSEANSNLESIFQAATEKM